MRGLERRRQLEAWQRFLSREALHLRERPASLFQQAANQPDNTVCANAALARLPSDHPPAHWLRWVNKPGTVAPFLADVDAALPCAISPNGRLVVAAGHEGGLWVWDADTGQQRLELLPAPHKTLQCSFSPDGRLVGALLEGGRLRLFDIAASGRSPEPFSEECVSAFVFLPDGRVLLSTSFGYTVQVHAAGGRCESMGKDMHLPGITVLAVSRDGVRAASSARDGTVKLWDLVTGAVLATWYSGQPEWRTRPNSIHSLAFSPDGRMLVTASYSPQVDVWNATDGAHIGRVTLHRGDVSSCAFTPEGNLVSVGGDGIARRSDLFGAGESVILADTLTLAARGFVSGDGRRLLTTTADHLRVWSTEGIGRPVAHSAWTTAAVFTADGCHLVSASGDGTLIGWDGASGEKRYVLAADPVKDVRPQAITGCGNQVYCCALSRDGSLIASGHRDGAARIWNASKRSVEALLEGHGGSVNACAFTSAGRHLITLDDEGAIRRWELDRSPPSVTTLAVEASAFVLAQTDDQLVVGFVDGRLALLDLTTGSVLREIAALRGGVHQCLLVGRYARMLVAASERQIVAISVASGRIHVDREGHPPIATDPAGRFLAFQREEGVLEILQLADGNPGRHRSFRLSGGRVWTCAFSVDGDYLATAGEFGRVHVLRVSDGQESMAFWLEAPCRVLAWNPVKNALVTGSLAGEVVLLQVESPGSRRDERSSVRRVPTSIRTPPGPRPPHP